MGKGLISPHTNSLHLFGSHDGPTVAPVLLRHSQKQLSEDGNKKMLQNTANDCLHFKNGNMPAERI